MLFNHLTQSPYSYFIPTSKKYNFLIAVFPMDGNCAFRVRNKRETNRLVKPGAGDM
jgi:hypothetical protein